MSGEPGYVRWQPKEWLRVAVNMLPYLEKGDERFAALSKSQKRCLQKERHRDDESLRKLAAAGNSTTNEYLQKARMLSDEERAMHYVPTPAEAYAAANPDAPVKPRKSPSPRKRLDEGRDYKGNFRWTTLEKAKVARMVQWFKDHGVTSSLGRMMVEAQELVLSADRRRAVSGIMQGNHTGANERAFKDGVNNLWLLKDVPFNPPLPPGAEPAQDQQESANAEQAQEATETANSEANALATVDTVPGTVSAPQSGSLREALTLAVGEFGDTLRGAMDKLLLTHTALVVHQLQSRIDETARQTATEMAALIEHGIAGKLRGVLLEELGGPSSTPTPPGEGAELGKAVATPGYSTPPAPAEAEAESTSEAGAAPKSKLLKVDVVGFNHGRDEETVRSGFMGQVDIRFVNPDKERYAPHSGRECIMITGRVPHAIRHRLKAAKVEPIYVRPTTGHVIQAIEQLVLAHGVAAAAHAH